MNLSRPRSWIAPAALALIIPGTARAEFFTDFYFGAALTQNTTVRIEDEFTFPETVIKDRTDIDPSFTLGARFGWWVDPAPWLGFSFDFSYFEAEGGPIEFNHIYPFSFLFMFRLPLARSPEFPYGRFQPYVAVGPSVFFSEAEIDARPFATDEVSESSGDFGLDARAGFSWVFVRNIAIFIEYRFTYFRQHIEDDDFFLNAEISSTQSLSTHHALLGFSFRF